MSDLVSLIEHVQASLKLIESAIARETPGSQEATDNVIVLDDVTPLSEGDGGVESLRCQLAIALRSLLDPKASELHPGNFAEGFSARQLRRSRLRPARVRAKQR